MRSGGRRGSRKAGGKKRERPLWTKDNRANRWTKADRAAWDRQFKAGYADAKAGKKADVPWGGSRRSRIVAHGYRSGYGRYESGESV